MRNTACQCANRIHLLGLRHLGFQRFLLCHLNGINNGDLFGCFLILVDNRIHIIAEVTAFFPRMAGIKWCDIALTVTRGFQRMCQMALFIVMNDFFKLNATVNIVTADHRRE
ncbi:hypothetical protein D3C80_1483330 [compost metagenome]